MSFPLRLTIAVALVAAVHLGLWITRSGGLPTEVRPPEPDLRTLPLKLGEWTGEDTELDPRIFRETGAEYAVNRRYRGPGGAAVSVHVAAITGYGVEGIDHTPPTCYVFNGYELHSIKRRQLPAGPGRKIPVSFSTWSRDDEQAAVAYWYHFGDAVFLTKDEFKRARRRHWGTRLWPPVVKVLLHTSADRQDRPPGHLEEFAKYVAQWTLASSGPRGLAAVQ